jgi:hypothetical protein
MKSMEVSIFAGLVAMANGVQAQGILFDFENASPHTGLPISLTVDGLTAHFSATGQGFAIQSANTMGFTPAGFSGLCIYPNSIDLSDLKVAFSKTLSAFSILYAPQELACDSSARMRVTAYRNDTFVGTSTMTADPPGTWPTATLAIQSAQGFNNVVVHYDAPPPTGGDYGPIFMADNMNVTVLRAPWIASMLPAAPGMILSGANGLPGGMYYVLESTNVTYPGSQWTRMATNQYDMNGNFTCPIPMKTDASPHFYLLQEP